MSSEEQGGNAMKHNAIIVGGSSGMGFGAAQAALAQGGKVLICSRSQEKLEAAKARLERDAAPGSVSIKTLDNTNEEQVHTVCCVRALCVHIVLCHFRRP